MKNCVKTTIKNTLSVYRLVCILFVLSICIFGVTLPIRVDAKTTNTTTASTFRFEAWIPYWAKSAGSAEAQSHLGQLNEISPFAYDVNDDGTVHDTAKLNQTSASSSWPSLFTKAHALGVKIIPTFLWSHGDAIYSILSSSTARQAHVAILTNIASSTQVDGIDIDYEGKTSATKAFFSQFIKDLYTALHKEHKTLTCTIESRTPLSSRYVSVPTDFDYANDYVVLNKYCDEVRVLAYDQQRIDITLNKLKGGGGLVPYMPIADLDWVRKVVNVTVATIQPKKVILAVPTYGHEYQISKTASSSPFTYTRIGSIGYDDAMALAVKTGSTPTRNAAGELSFTYQDGTSTKLVWFSDSVAIAQKIKLAKTSGLGGVSIYKLDGDGDQAFWNSLIK